MILIELIFYILAITAIPGMLNLAGIYSPKTFKLSELYLIYSLIMSCVIAFVIVSLIMTFMMQNAEYIRNISMYKLW